MLMYRKKFFLGSCGKRPVRGPRFTRASSTQNDRSKNCLPIIMLFNVETHARLMAFVPVKGACVRAVLEQEVEQTRIQQDGKICPTSHFASHGPPH